MGFLRKVGRKIKKGVKKLFSSKIGSFLGGIALTYMMGPLFERVGGFFSGKVTEAGTQQAIADAAGTTIGEVASESAAQEAILKGGEFASAAADKGVGTELSTNAIQKSFEAGNSFTKANSLSTTIAEGTMNGEINPFASQTLTETLQNVNNIVETGQPITSTLTTMTPSESVVSASRIPETVTVAPRTTPIQLDVGEIAPDQFAAADISTPQLVESKLPFVQRAKNFGKEYFGNQFLPDVATGVTTSLITSSVLGDGEAPFVGGGVQPQPSMEAAQGAYVAEVQNQIPQMQGMDFNQLNQSLFYGTLSPQWLMSQGQYA